MNELIGNLERWAEDGGVFLTREDLWKMLRTIKAQEVSHPLVDGDLATQRDIGSR